MHYLHHKYFECNYSSGNTTFLDYIFGTFHDGSDISTKKTLDRMRKKFSFFYQIIFHELL